MKATNGILELGSSIFIDSKNLKFPDEIMKIKKIILIGSSDYRCKSSRILTYEIRIFFRSKDSPEKKKSNDKDKKFSNMPFTLSVYLDYGLSFFNLLADESNATQGV